MIIAGTGHRPDKLGGYSDAVFKRLVALATASLRRYQPTLVISGMALGWDQALTRAALNLDIPVHAYIPFEGQESKWPEANQDKYHMLLALCAEKIICCKGFYASWKMQRRNEMMVDACDSVLALWNGSSGGTANCLAYVHHQGKSYINVWKSWEKYK